MKTAIFCYTVVSLTLINATVNAQSCHEQGGANGPQGPYATNPYQATGNAPAYPYNNYPLNAATAPAALPQAGLGGSLAAPSVQPTTPQARITVVDASSPLPSQGSAVKSSVQTARLTVVDNEPVVVKPAVTTTEATLPVDQANAVIASAETKSDEAPAEISDALKDLVGTWKAVARTADGELNTVELRLDDRGWAELTVPTKDGKPSTIKRRAELENQELKLTGPDAELLLGQILEVNSRQMVLARANGQVTFVRP